MDAVTSAPAPGVSVESTPSRLRITALLGDETIAPAMMSLMVTWTLGLFTLIMGFVAAERDLPRRFDAVYGISLGCVLLIFAAANFFDRVHVTVNAEGIAWGVRPIPVNGYPFHRRLRALAIAGIYVAQYDLTRRFRYSPVRSYEVHALTTAGEAVRLLQRLPQAAAEELAAAIRQRLGPSSPIAAAPLRGGVRSASEEWSGFSGIPAWFCWLLLLITGLEGFALPLVRVARWQQASATITRTGGLYHARRACTVRFEAPGGPVSAPLQNDCARGAKRGDGVTVYFDPARPTHARILLLPFWHLDLVFAGLGILAFIAGRQRHPREGDARVLWKDRFQRLDRYWRVDPKNAIAARGVLTVSGLSGECALRYTAGAFDPATLRASVAAGERVGAGEGAGILFGSTFEGTGYVFGILPQTQSAFALHLVHGLPIGEMAALYVREIHAGRGEWNTLQVVIAEGRASFSVNGGRAGFIEYHPPMGGGIVGLWAKFASGQTVWQFSNMTVLGPSR